MTYLNTNWLITGGTSGLGLALAVELKARGAHVAIVARDEARLKDVAERFRLIPIAGDVGEKRQTYRIASAAAAALGDLDFFVNAASSLGAPPLKLLNDTDCEEFEEALRVNLLGVFRLSKAVSGPMLLRGKGCVLNISSDAAQQPYPKWGAYGVSKAALDHLTRIWAEESRGSGVRWLSIDPGDMDTPLHSAAVPDADVSKLKTPALAARQLLSWLDLSPASGTRGAL